AGSINKPIIALSILLSLVWAPVLHSAESGESISLFDGKSLDGWMNASGQKPGDGWVIEGGVLIRKTQAGDIWTKQRYGNFVLTLEFQTKGNSGVFIRTDDPKDNVQTGIEIQVDKPRPPGKHSVGAAYDLLAPSKNAATDGWNKMVITARGSLLKVELNGELIIDLDLDRWTEPGKNPDGTKNKFKTALKNFKREGHIGFQDHGAEVSYRNVRIKPL
ncbi:MAG: DUF1080 domain-containing protein, partial [Verrucomicrobiota bacterium]